MRPRPRDRADNNAKTLDERARAHGVSIWYADRPFDRIWGVMGITVLVEYKNPATSYGKAGLNPVQTEIARSWRGGPVYVVSTVAEVESTIAELKRLGRVLTQLRKVDAPT